MMKGKGMGAEQNWVRHSQKSTLKSPKRRDKKMQFCIDNNQDESYVQLLPSFHVHCVQIQEANQNMNYLKRSIKFFFHL